jgi:DNA-directed RNA polymerase subunit K/omega
MRSGTEGRVEELSKLVGGRFKLTTLVQKQAREYIRGGRAFMPSVRNMDELFEYILDEIEQGRIQLLLPGEQETEDQTAAQGQAEPQ